MSDKITVGVGRTATWTITCLGKDGNPVLFAGTETLASAVWQGGNQLPLFSPVVGWVAPVAPETTTDKLTLTVEGAQTKGLAAGLYRIDVDLADGPQDIWDGFLQLTPTPGTVVGTDPVYCTYADMLELFPGLEEFDGNDLETQFLSERKRARRKIDRAIVEWYSHLLTRGLSYEGYSRSLPDTSVIEGYLAADKLVVSDRVREAAARYALAFVLEYSVGSDDKENRYAQIGRENRNKANRIMDGLTVRLRDDAAGYDYSLGEDGVVNNVSTVSMSFPSPAV